MNDEIISRLEIELERRAKRSVRRHQIEETKGYTNMESLELTERERDELRWCLMYFNSNRWGTDGHNRMIMAAKIALQAGYMLGPEGELLLP